MTKSYFSELMEEMGCRAKDGMAFGAKGGIPYNVEYAKGGKSPVLIACFKLEGPVKECVKLAKNTPMQYTKWTSEEAVLTCTMQLASDFYAKSTLHSVLAAMQKYVAEAGCTAAVNCPLCANPACEVYAWIGDAYVPAHETCIETKLELPLEDVKRKIPAKGNWITGILGAVLGAFVGAVPAFARFIIGVQPSIFLYAFIPIFSALMYRLCRGKARRNLGGVCILLVSILMAVLIQQVGFWVHVSAQNPEMQVSFLQTIPAYFETYTFPVALRQMAFGLVLIGIGCLPAARILRGYENSHGAVENLRRGKNYTIFTIGKIQDFEEKEKSLEQEREAKRVKEAALMEKKQNKEK